MTTTAPSPAATPPKHAAPALSDRTRAEHRLGWMLAGPAFAVMLLVTAYPILQAIYDSLFNYRLTDPASPTPAVYPTHNQDVAAAVAWVHDHIRDYGGDPSRIALLGHSAGAQLAADKHVFLRLFVIVAVDAHRGHLFPWKRELSRQLRGVDAEVLPSSIAGILRRPRSARSIVRPSTSAT